MSNDLTPVSAPAAAQPLSQGLHCEVPAAIYHADPCPSPSLSQGLAKILLERSPLHAWAAHPRLGGAAREPEEYRKDRTIGNAAHLLVLGRGKELAVAEFADWRTKAAKEFREEAESEGREPILRAHFDTAERVAGSIRRQLDAQMEGGIFQSGKAEVVLIWEESGVWFRTMMDWLHDDLQRCDDLKTTGTSAAPQDAGKMMADGGWDVQASFWERGLNHLGIGEPGRRIFRFVAVENEPPYGLTVNRLTEGVLTMGRQKLELAVKLWRRCIESGQWPGYSTVTNYPEFPGWRQVQWEERIREGL